MSKIKLNQDSLKTSREYKRHKVNDGSNVFRILPPFGDVDVHNNYVFKRWAVAWLVNPTTGKRTPFSSPFTAGEEACPVKEYSDALGKFIDKKKATLEAGGLSADQVRDELKDLRDIQWQIKLNYVYAYNACDKSGTVGILEVKSTAHKGIKKCMREYISDFNQDPTSLNSDLREDSGVWLNIQREGQGKNTEYSVTFSQRKVKDKDTGEVTVKMDRSPLPESVVENYDELGYNLFSLYRQKSYNELRDILIYNLSLIAQEVPDAVLPGYEEAINVAGDSAGEEHVEEANVEEPVAKTKSTKTKVNIALDEDDDEDDDEEAVASGSSIDDIKSFADSILED